MTKIKIDEITNKSYLFLPPMVAPPANIVNNECTGVFLADVDKPKYNQHVFILFENLQNLVANTNREKQLENNDLFVKKYMVFDDYTMYIYKIHNETIKDYNNFLQSKYSLISDGLKKKILKYHNLNLDSKLYKILYKTEDYRKSLEEIYSNYDSKGNCVSPVHIPKENEYMSIIDLKDEVFDISNYN